jgi:UDP-N-acetylmuramoyl-tripeptide--D-alanyl-D-alanine ligase
MKKFLIAELARIIKAHEPEVTSDERRFFNGVSIDSRTIKAGDCFFAIIGDNFDGHSFVADAFGKGAACAVVSKDIAGEKFPGKYVLKVNDTIEALGHLAREYRRRMNFKVVAITGSVGKTTTRQIIHHVLSQRFRVFQAPKNFNNNIGLPLTLLSAEPEDKIIVAEIGTNSPGEIAYLTGIALPDIAVITSVHPVHLTGFGDLQTIIQEKLSIAKGLRDNGVLIINGDYDRLVAACREGGTKFITFGKSNRCDIQAQNITLQTTGSRFAIDAIQVTVPLLGPGNVENALAAWSVCSRFGIDIACFARAVGTLPAIPMRAELLQIGTLTVLNDCYNANPASMKNALDILARLAAPAPTQSKENPRLVFICADMAELGRQGPALHAELGASIAQAKVQLLLAVGKLAKIAAEAAKKTANYKLQVNCFTDTISLCNNLKRFIKNYDIILVKGSRVAKLEMVIEKLKELFSQTMK